MEVLIVVLLLIGSALLAVMALLFFVSSILVNKDNALHLSTSVMMGAISFVVYLVACQVADWR